MCVYIHTLCVPICVCVCVCVCVWATWWNQRARTFYSKSNHRTLPCARHIHVPSLDNPSTQKALNGLKRSVWDAQHPSGLILFFDLLGLHGHNVTMMCTWFFHHTKKRKKSYPTTLFPIKQKKKPYLCI
jgi:hypothetical protein